MFKISVIIPCYNVSNYIDRCLTSIVNQTIGIESLQIICVDDASTDDTLLCLQRWEQQYPDNILLIPLETNSRQGTCRNVGIQYVDAPWVTFIDSDDWIEPDYCEIMYTYADELNCDVVCCSYKRDFSDKLCYLNDKNTGESFRYLLVDTIEKRKTFLRLRSMEYSSWGKLIHTDFLGDNQIYFPENLAYEDNFWSSLLHLYAERVFIVEKYLYHYYVNSNSTIMKKDANYHTDYITIYLLIWEEWKKRGFYPTYKYELECDYCYSFYLCFLRILIIRYSTPQFHLFMLLRQLFLERIPDYRSNPYIEERFDEFNKLMLQAMFTPMGKKDFLLLAEHAQLYWMIQSRNN